jgi:hypothetical protein
MGVGVYYAETPVRAAPGDKLEIVSDDRAFDAVGDRHRQGKGRAGITWSASDRS